jgi:hypothetical protein
MEERGSAVEIAGRRGVVHMEKRSGHGSEGSSQGEMPWLLALLPARWLLLREGQGAGGVEEAGAEGEKGLLLARKRSRGPTVGRGAKLHACCREAGRKKVRGKITGGWWKRSGGYGGEWKISNLQGRGLLFIGMC